VNTAREILKQADDLKREQTKMDELAAQVEKHLNGTDCSISLGNGWFAVPVSAISAIADAVLAHQNHLTDQIDALEARVQVVES